MSDEVISPEETTIQLADVINEYSLAFDKLTQERHEAGAKEYGVVTFLSNDVVRMMAEELADTSNYCRMQFIKLMMLQHMLEKDITDKMQDENGNITIGIKAFRGVGETGWN